MIKVPFLGIISWFLLLFYLVLVFAPLLWIVISSFKTNAEFFSRPVGIPSRFVWQNFKAVLSYGGSFSEEPLMKFLGNSAVVTFLGTVINLLLALPASYLFLYSFRYKDFLYSFLTFGLFLPTSAFMVPYMFIVSRLGLYDTRLGIALTYAGMTLPLSFLIIQTYMRINVPRDIIEAASLDGASFHQIFIRIAIPLSRGGTITAVVFLTITFWNELLYALLFSQSEGSRTIQIAISSLISTYAANYPQAFAAITISIAPIIVVYAMLNKYIVSGLSVYIEK
jgi:raffinose/stachyose/melibiose transport system permease protein